MKQMQQSVYSSADFRESHEHTLFNSKGSLQFEQIRELSNLFEYIGNQCLKVLVYLGLKFMNNLLLFCTSKRKRKFFSVRNKQTLMNSFFDE